MTNKRKTREALPWCKKHHEDKCHGCQHVVSEFARRNQALQYERDKVEVERSWNEALASKVERLQEALEKIRDFGHKEGCPHEYTVPVYECCCFDLDQADIARLALESEEDDVTK